MTPVDGKAEDITGDLANPCPGLSLPSVSLAAAPA